MSDSERNLSTNIFPSSQEVAMTRPTITSLLAQLHAPIPDRGYKVHDKFGTVNFRGKETHKDVFVSRRPDPDPRFNTKVTDDIKGVSVVSGDYLILTPLNQEEIASAGDMLALFLNEVGIYPESPEIYGALVLNDHHLDLEDSDLNFRVGIIRSRKLMVTGQPGLMFDFVKTSTVIKEDPYVKVKLNVMPPQVKISSNELGFLSDEHRLAYDAITRATEPDGMAFVNRAALQAVDLIDSAISSRRLDVI